MPPVAFAVTLKEAAFFERVRWLIAAPAVPRASESCNEPALPPTAVWTREIVPVLNPSTRSINVTDAPDPLPLARTLFPPLPPVATPVADTAPPPVEVARTDP